MSHLLRRLVFPAALVLAATAPARAQQPATPLWSGRFDVAPDKALLAWGASFSFDKRLFEDDVAGSLAWAEALTRAGVLDAAESAAIQRGLNSILESGRSSPAFLSGPDEDIHSFVERVLIERIGEPGRRLHTGRSRNDQVAVDMRLYVRRRVPDIQRSLLAVIDALVGQATSASDAVMPSYTHVRRAQPVLAEPTLAQVMSGCFASVSSLPRMPSISRAMSSCFSRYALSACWRFLS